MNNIPMNRITEEMLKKNRIISMGQISEVNEVNEHETEPCLHVKYENGRDEYIKGTPFIENFINNIIASR